MAPQKRAGKRAGDDLAESQLKKLRRSQRQPSVPSENKESQKKKSTPKLEAAIPHKEHEVIEVDTEPQGSGITLKKIKKVGEMSLGFPDGDVYIKIGNHARYHYKLHSSILSRASAWFRRSFNVRPTELEGDSASYLLKKTNISSRFEMAFGDDFTMGYLVRVVSLNLPSMHVLGGM